MPLKEITCQVSGQVFKMGRRAPLAPISGGGPLFVPP